MKTLRKYTFILLSAVISFVIATGCSSDGPEPDPTPASTHRTLIIYMAADNNLSRYSDDNIRQTLSAVEAGALQGGRIVLFRTTPTGQPYLAEINEKSGEFEVIKEYDDNTSCLEPSRMNEIISDAIRLAPADEYGLILWSHGTGWINESDSRATANHTDVSAARPYSFGVDSYGPSSTTIRMSVPSLAKALENFKFRFIYFDCCFMATVETVYELRDLADYIIASPTELPVEGMPYTTNIPEMMKPSLNLKQIAANTLAYYLSGEASLPYCTITLVNTEYLDRLAAATKAIMQTGAVNSLTYSPLPYYRNSVPSYLWDMHDFINNLDVDQALLSEWNQAFDKAVEYYGHTDISYYVPMTGTHGLGAFYYSPATEYLIDRYDYPSLAWWRDVVSYNPSINP